MAGFMGQKGTLVVCGNTGHAFADSMYATTCYVGGTIGGLGTDAVVEPLRRQKRRNYSIVCWRNIFRRSCARRSRQGATSPR